MRIRHWIFIVAGFILFAMCPALAAKAPQFSVETWTDKNGLPQNSVFAITQARDGYLWLGTPSGLSRFDGVDFKSYEDKDIPGLNGSKIVKLFEDSQGNLWLGTETAGVLLASKDGKITTVLPPKGMVEGHLVRIVEDIAGGVWLSMANGQLYHYMEGNLHQIADRVRNLAADTAGIVWIGSPDGRVLGLGPVSKSTPNAFAISYETPVVGLDFLFASEHGGYWRMANGRIEKCLGDHVEKDLGPYPWQPKTGITAVAEDQEGNLIVGTYGDGAYWFDKDGTAHRIEGLPHSFVLSLDVDREGTLWVGTDGGGLHRVKRSVFEVLAGTRGLAVQSVCEDGQGGLWIGYNWPHVDHWTPAGLQQYYTNSFVDAASFRPIVKTVYIDKKGMLWVGTASESGESGWRPPCLFQFRDGHFEAIGAINSFVTAIFEDRRGTMWLGTPNGLFRRDEDQWRKFTTQDGLSADAVRAIAEDASGNLWIGTERGLNRMTEGKFTAYRKQDKDGLPSDSITSLYADHEGVLWVGTASGLARFFEGKWTRYTSEDGLHNNKIGYLIEDLAGYLWLGSNRGLMRTSLRDLNEFAKGIIQRIPCRTFGTVDGLPTGECTSGSQPGPCRTLDGKMWFPTIQGLAGVEPALLHRNTNAPPVVIESVRIDNKLQGSDALRAPGLKSITVPPGKRTVEIDFTCLNLSAPEKSRFSSQLKGHEEVAIERPARDRSVRYNLPPGEYEFKVTACNEDGEWNRAGASLAITVLPAFWQTRSFIGLVVFALLALIIGSVYYIATQRLHQQVAVLRQQEALERERARIARDLHDQLGANLTQVALLGEMAESDKELPEEVESHARQISQTARDTTHALDEIVWTVNPSNDTLDGLINYICKYSQDYFALAGMRYRLEAPSELPSTPISPEFRHNVFLVAKEAVNNVVKHAQATSAIVRLVLQPGAITLEIEDDGKGMAGMDQKAASMRNGLRNMRKRMEDVGGSFSMEPGSNGGTIVRLFAPLGKR